MSQRITTASEERPPLDPTVCQKARLARDTRFDGEFFTAVRTTGIYCRPICPARAPKEQNVEYFRSAAESAAHGYRPCLRCRPESAPRSPAWRGTATTVDRALDLIQQGALNGSAVADLAARLGVGERYLRKLFQKELGVSPAAVAQNQRLLFARKLLFETGLPVTDIALAAGYRSLRRFNSAMRDHFACSPTEMRRRHGDVAPGGLFTLQLSYRPPYDWDGIADFFGRHVIEGLERVDERGYWRRFTWRGTPAEMRVAPAPGGRSALSLELRLDDNRDLMTLVARIRRMFDLDANPEAIATALGADPVLAPLVERFAGIRCPRVLFPWESAVRAVVGQQVSIGAARSVLQHLALACADGSDLQFPGPRALLELDDDDLRMPKARKATLRALCRATLDNHGELPTLEQLGALKGIGPWTLNLVAMRGLGDPDVFPVGDLGLVRAFEALGPEASSPIAHSERWRPWRGYAANLLWRSLLA